MDKKTNCTCFSVEFPNCYLFKKFRERNPSSIWAVILVDSSILLENDRDIYYCYHNAARYDVKEKLSRGNLRSLKDFENLFREVEYYNRGEFSGTNYRKDIFYIKDYLTTSPQAEILVSGVIPSRYINSVIFASQLDLSHFSDVSLSKINDSKNIKNKLKVNHKYFLKREEVNFPERGV